MVAGCGIWSEIGHRLGPLEREDVEQLLGEILRVEFRFMVVFVLQVINSNSVCRVLLDRFINPSNRSVNSYLP